MLDPGESPRQAAVYLTQLAAKVHIDAFEPSDEETALTWWPPGQSLADLAALAAAVAVLALACP
jgi:hypothetical protein